MTKTELLTDLLSRAHVDSLIGDPSDITPQGDPLKWYKQNYLELVGNAAVKRDIVFYVKAQGTGDEKAFYKDAEPTEQVRANAFKTWLETQLYVLSVMGTIHSWATIRVSEFVGHALVAMIEPDGSGKANLKGYFCKKDGDGNLEKVELNMTADVIAQVIKNKL